MIRIPGQPETERRVQQAAEKSFSLKAKDTTDYVGLCRKTALSGSRSFKTSEKLKFLFLQREFEGKSVVGFRRFVSTGRLVLSTLRRLRGSV